MITKYKLCHFEKGKDYYHAQNSDRWLQNFR